MGPVSASKAMDAPRERVFATICDLALRPAFCDHFIHEFRIERLESSGEGAAARFRVEPPGFKTWMETVITEVESPHLISERGRCGRNDRVPVVTAWELLEGPAALTTVRVTFLTKPSNALDRFRERLGSERWYRRQWSTALRRLAELVESGEPVPRVEVAGAG